MRFRRVQYLLFAAACTLTASAGCATSGGKKGMYSVECNDKPLTGSHIGRTKCWRRIDIEERRRRDHASMEKIQFGTARRKGGAR
jgi:hypothetical protein